MRDDTREPDPDNCILCRNNFGGCPYHGSRR
jgi:hypothetical protein